MEASFEPLPAFPSIERTYTSEKVFPLFSNRVLPSNRAEYDDYLKWLNIPETERDPIAILARSGGQRATDTLEVFPMPSRNDSGCYEFHFLVHGLSHMPRESAERVAHLRPGERLLAMRDVQNAKDAKAIALRTAETLPNDVYIVGYLPRYFCNDFFDLAEGGIYPEISVERVNSSPAPIQFRLLCKAILPPECKKNLCSHDEYQSVSASNALG
ncbi:MAG TPA: HIRAN domain-containing protein [Bryobacteraceae bacterium]|nr:HIRAN domain-containing protein [Bryobacteraceae bacterium]